MYEIISWEVAILLLNFLVFYKFKVGKMFINSLFNKIKIYLPFLEADLKQILTYRKDKKESRIIVRSAEMPEYTLKTTEDKYFDFEFFVIFYLVNLSTLVMYEFKNLSSAYLNSNSPDIFKPNFNVVTSFNFISFVYIVYYLLNKQIFLKGVFGVESRIFILLFVISFSIMFFCLQFYPEILNVHFETVLEIVNDRFTRINNEIKRRSDMDVDLLSIFNVNITKLKIFYAALFSLIFSILYRPCMRSAYFDHYMLITFQQRQQPEASFGIKRVLFFLKGKIILGMLELLMLLEPLFYKPFLYNSSNTTYSLGLYIFLLGLVFLIEFILSFNYYWHQASIFNWQNYTHIINYNSIATEKSLGLVNSTINFINSRFWNIFQHLFILIFCPIFLFFSFAFRNEYIYYIVRKKSITTIQPNFVIKRLFFENCLFFILLAFVAAKNFISYGRLFYLLLSGLNKRDLYLMG